MRKTESNLNAHQQGTSKLWYIHTVIHYYQHTQTCMRKDIQDYE